MKTWKKIYFIYIMAVLTVVPAACNRSESQSHSQTLDKNFTAENSAESFASSGILEMYIMAMLNEVKFSDKNAGDIYFQDIPSANLFDFNISSLDEAFEGFALIDMDEDGVPELLLNFQTRIDSAVYVLHYHGGVLYGNAFGYRAMKSLKKDGTFDWSSSAFDSGTGRLKFRGAQAEVINAQSKTNDEAVWNKLTINNANDLEELYRQNLYVSAVSDNADYFIRTYGEIFGILESNEAMNLLRMNANPFTDIEMVGWSNSGLFAYRHKYLIDDGMIYCWVYSLVIINAVTDEILKEDTAAVVDIKEDPENREYIDSISGILNFKIFFKNELEEATIEYSKRWNIFLGEHNISARVSAPFSETFRRDLLQFPINDFYSWLDHSIITLRQVDSDYETDIVSWKLIIGNDKVKKIITENKDQEHRIVDNISGRKILGYYKSPYENRIVAAVIHYRYTPISGGYHGVKLNVFGCNMNVGLN